MLACLSAQTLNLCICYHFINYMFRSVQIFDCYIENVCSSRTLSSFVFYSLCSTLILNIVSVLKDIRVVSVFINESCKILDRVVVVVNSVESTNIRRERCCNYHWGYNPPSYRKKRRIESTPCNFCTFLTFQVNKYCDNKKSTLMYSHFRTFRK